MPELLRRLTAAAGGIALAALCLSGAGPARAADFAIAPSVAPALYAPLAIRTGEGWDLSGTALDFTGYHHIRMTGEIVPGDAEKLLAVVKEIDLDPFGNTILSMNSPGGNFEEALLIGDILTGQGIGTLVGDGDVCLSACAFAFLGGSRMVIRNVLWEPWRHLHFGGTLGFHSPSLPGAVPTELLEGETGFATFAQIAAPTRQNIQALQQRAGRWEVSSNLLFDILGIAAADEFLFIERFHEAFDNRITIVSDGPRPYPGFGLVEAVQACRQVLGIFRWEADRTAPLPWFTAARDGVFPAFGAIGAAGVVTGTSDELDGAFFEITNFIPGLGSPKCLVSRVGGKLRVQTDGNFADLSRTFAIAYGSQVNEVYLDPLSVLGFAQPWTSLDAPGIMAGIDAARIVGDLPEDLAAQAATYDFCAPGVAGTWPPICAHPPLHAAVKALTAVVERARETRPDAAGAYAAWTADIRRLCRPAEEVDADPLASEVMAYCGLSVTMSHLYDARSRWLPAP